MATPWLRSRILQSAIVLGAGAALLLLTFRLSQVVLVREWPYDESVNLLALGSEDATCCVWSEHPPLGYWVLKVTDRMGASPTLQRGFCAFLYITACGVMMAVFGSVPCLPNAKPSGPWLPVVMSLTVFCTPTLLAYLFRIGPEAIALLSLALLLLSASRTLDYGGYPSAALTLCAGLVLTWVHAYGLLLTASISLAGTAVAWLPGLRPREAKPSPIAARIVMPLLGGLAVLCVLLDRHAFLQRLKHLTDSYWTVPAIDSFYYHIPFSFVWSDAFDAWQTRLPIAGLQAFMFGLIAFAVVRRKLSWASALFAGTYVCSIAIVIVVEILTGEWMLLPHKLACVFLLATTVIYFLIRDVGGVVPQKIFVYVLLMLIVPKTIFTLFDPRNPDQKPIHDAADAIISGSDDVTGVLFAGPRAYAIFYPLLPASLREKSWVFIPSGRHPESVPGRALVPLQRRLSKGEIEKLHSASLVFVEVSQKPTVDIAGWKIGATQTYFPAYVALGRIHVIQLAPRERLAPAR